MAFNLGASVRFYKKSENKQIYNDHVRAVKLLWNFGFCNPYKRNMMFCQKRW